MKYLGKGSNDLATPKEAVLPLLEYIPHNYKIWECAVGEGRLLDIISSLGYDVFGDKNENFLLSNRDDFDIIITNPPFNKKNQFLYKAFQYKKPFALLLPITTLEGSYRQQLFSKYGIQILLLNKRIDFTGKGNPWFAVACFTSGIFSETLNYAFI
jgi:hypothetical protein